jgi:DNA-binding NarL/FixJ family response regulator
MILQRSRWVRVQHYDGDSQWSATATPQRNDINAACVALAPQLEERILAALKAGETIRGVADKFDVNPSTVQRIKHPFVVTA